MPCPYCGEPFGGAPRLCPHCEEDLSPALAGVIARRIAAATREDVAAGRFRDPPASALRAWRTGTVVAAAVLLLSIVLVAAIQGWRAGGPKALVGVLSVLAGVASLVTVVVMGIQDLVLGNPSKPMGPLETARLWTRALSHKRWGLAFHLTLPRGRAEERPNGLGEALGAAEAGSDFATPGGFRDAWKPVLHGGGGVQRRSSFSDFVLEREEGDEAAVSCILTVKTRDAVVGIGGDTDRFPLTLRLLEVGGRWHVIDGAPCPEQPLED